MMVETCLSEYERERYSRQIIIEDFGEEGQLKLKKACVAVFGVGGLGSPASIYLTAAGVGRLILVDSDRVELNNLNRQVLHWNENIGRLKVESGTEKLARLNPNVKIEGKSEKITPDNIEELLEGVDVVVDGMDNYPTRYLINEACVKRQIPFVHGAVEGLFGQITTIIPGKSPCLKCIFPEEPPRKPIFPILGSTAGVIGCLEAMEVVKLITGVGELLVGRMLIFDGSSMRLDVVSIKRDLNCPVCGAVKEK